MEDKRSSTFSVTCNLLSHYIKANMPSFPPASSGISGESYRQTPTTMPLLPGAEVEVAVDKEDEVRKTREIVFFPQCAGFDESKDSTEKSKLTIFYGGKVLVFDNFPADKAKDIMHFANNAQNHTATPPVAATQQRPIQARATDIPMARNNSLRRFLQKRKDRITARAPYQVSMKEVESGSWLGLETQISPLPTFSSETSR